MIRKHMTIFLALLLLIPAFILTSCSQKDPISNNPVDQDPVTKTVASLSLMVDKSNLQGYYGSRDSVLVTVTAKDNAGSVVAGATITVTVAPAVGFVDYRNGNLTNDSGVLTAYYMTTYVADDQVDLQAIAGTVKSSTKTVTVDSKDIRVSATANPSEAVAIAGEMAQSEIRVQVLNSLGVAVPGVPIGLEIINGADATLSEPAFNTSDYSYTSTLTVDEVLGLMEIQLRAYVDIPVAQITSDAAGKGVVLPVVVPSAGGPAVTGAPAGEQEVGASPVVESTPQTSKSSVQLRTWKPGAGPGDKGLRKTADVVDSDTLSVTWTTWGSQVSQIYLGLDPRTLKAMPNESREATVTAVAADENNNGIPNLQIYLKLRNVNLAEDVGTITIPAPTDANGRTTAIVSSNGEYGTWVIEARTTPTQTEPWTDTLTVAQGSEVVSAFLEVSPDMIYTEPGISATATVRAIAYNERNNGVPKFKLHLTLRDEEGTPIGATIAQPDSTDSTGTALTTIRTNGDYGNWVVEVRAYENQTQPLATKPLTVTEGSAIASINLLLDKTHVNSEPDANKQINVYATARDQNSSALENRMVYFTLSSDDGSVTGTLAASDTTDTAGVAQTIINTEGNFGHWRVEARAWPTQEPPLASRPLVVEEGSDVSDINIVISPDILTPAPQATDTAQVRLIAYNQYGTGVKDAELDLRVRNVIQGESAGTVSDPDSTGADGGTIATLLTNGRFGTWVVEARPYAASNLVFRDTVRVLEGTPQYLLAEADSNRIAVRGTNGLEQTTVSATIYTEHDVPFKDSTRVFFLAEEFPYNTGDPYRLKINNSYGQGSPYPDPRDPENGLPYDSVWAVNGVASVSVTSGSSKGLIRLKIWTEDEDGNEAIVNHFSGLQVVAGPPASIEVGVRSEGFEGGAETWDLEVNARIADVRGNEVGNGYTVYFAVDRPEIVLIEDIAYTGNESEHTTETSPGVAFSTLKYYSGNTNESVVISAFVLDANGDEISDDLEYVLPLIDPTGVLTVSPANWDYGEYQGDYAPFHLRLNVFDGHSILINGQQVQFSPAMGRIYKNDDINGTIQDNAITGPLDYPIIPGAPDDGDPDGVSYRWLLLTEDEAFPDPSVIQQQVQISAEIIGVPDATVEPVTVFLVRDTGAPAP